MLCRRAPRSPLAARRTRVAPRPRLLDGEHLPSEPRQRPSADTRARITDAALALFAERGYDGTSIGAIATRARLAVGSVYLHFRSKRQLLVALMDDLIEHLGRLDLRPAGTDVRAGLRSLLARALAADLRYLGAYRAWQEAALSDPQLAGRERAIHAWTTRRVEALFAGLQRLPGARADVDAAALAQILDPLFWTLLARASRLPRRQRTAWIDTLTHLLHHTLFHD